MKWVLIAPAAVLMLLLTVYPLAHAFRISFYTFTSTGKRFVGIENYLSLLSDQVFINSLVVTLKFVVLAVGLEFLIGFAIANLLNKKLRFRGTLQTIILIPMLVSGTVIGLLWRLIYTPDGLLSYITVQLTGEQVAWLSDPTLALISIVVADVWQWTPLVVLVMLAGLQSVPEHVYDAAVMDGASRWRIFVDIVLPYIKQLIFLVIILRVIGGVRIFAKVFLLTRGGPADATNVISVEMYRRAFSHGNFGQVSAIAIVLLVFVLLVSALFMRIADIEF